MLRHFYLLFVMMVYAIGCVCVCVCMCVCVCVSWLGRKGGREACKDTSPEWWSEPTIATTKKLLIQLASNPRVNLDVYIDIHAHTTATSGFMYVCVCLCVLGRWESF